MPLCLQAIAAGKPVLVEKPLGTSVEECEELRACVCESGLAMQVGNNRRFDPGVAFASSITIRLPCRAPAACGVKLTPIVHDCPGSSAGGQCGAALKSPVAAMPPMVNGPSPRSVRVTVCGGVVAPTFWLKFSRSGPSCTSDMVPTPITWIRCGLSMESSATTI